MPVARPGPSACASPQRCDRDFGLAMRCLINEAKHERSRKRRSMLKRISSSLPRNAALVAVLGSVLANLGALAILVWLQPMNDAPPQHVPLQALQVLRVEALDPVQLQRTRLAPIPPLAEEAEAQAAARSITSLAPSQPAPAAIDRMKQSTSPSAPVLAASSLDALDWRVEASAPTDESTAEPEHATSTPPSSTDASVEREGDLAPESADGSPSASPEVSGEGVDGGGGGEGSGAGEGDAPAAFLGARVTRNGNPQDYLPLRIRGRFSGTTKVEVTIDAQGSVISVQHLSSDVSQGYEDYARDAALEYAEAITVVTPAQRGDQAVRDIIVLEIVWEE